MSTAMDASRFSALADCYGSDPDRWPPAERDAALRLLEQSAAARELLQRQAQLDRLFAGVAPPPAPSPQLRRAILAAAPPQRRVESSWFAAIWAELGGARRAGPMLAAGLALGVVLTPLAAPPDVAPIEEGEDYAWNDEDYEELVP